MNTVALAVALVSVLPLRVMPLVNVTVVPSPPDVPVPASTAMVAVEPAARLPKVTAPTAPVPLEFEFSTVSVRWMSVSVPLHDVEKPLVSIGAAAAEEHGCGRSEAGAGLQGAAVEFDLTEFVGRQRGTAERGVAHTHVEAP